MTQRVHAGIAKQDITPDAECSLVGYVQRETLHPEGNAGVLDRLFLRVVIVESSEGCVAILSYDVCILEDPVADRLRSEVSDILDIPREAVLLAATHTHSGPYPWEAGWERARREFVPDRLLGEASQRYWTQLQKATRDAVFAARSDLSPASFRVRTTTVGFAYNRRIPGPDEVTMCWNLRETPDCFPVPFEENELVVAEIRRPAGDIVLFNVAGHPVVLGKTHNRVSADWPGAACRWFEERNPTTHAVFFHGAGADAHPWLATDHHPQDVTDVALPVASTVNLLYQSGGSMSEEEGVTHREITVQLAGRSVRLTAYRTGPLRWLACPGEVFGSSGRLLRAQCPGPLMLCSTSNGWSGYWPPQDILEQGGYETDAFAAFGFLPGDTERIVEAAVHLLNSI